ncbi:hypothetical protein BKA58DRAFT_85170 [Alternaria rosae]|uniref:uncharacterized protein n=1 Tax=Alternaria rosae TaxID=1187941 RepID=UPI001E8ED467|nr:uncharacterized protein BKA58DRAFT_85170 [Alternaria rosae]KAH6877918.1 hypothetical protein BKA58DRAFT_85170 [Alternaria rosae]
MRTSVLISALAALVLAVPYPQATDISIAPGATLISLSAILPISTTATPVSTSLNIPVTALPTSDPNSDDDDDDDNEDPELSSSKRKPHWEPIPIFTKRCQCQLATARYPCWATDALQSCHFEENFSYGCYMQAAGGCPTPTRICSNLFQPTPRPGPHPCELGPNPPVVTSFPNLTGSPTANVTLPVIPTANVTLPTVFLQKK